MYSVRLKCVTGLLATVAMGLPAQSVRADPGSYRQEQVQVAVSAQEGDTQARYFAVSVPSDDAAMPEEGWPVILVFHGANGTALQWVDSGLERREYAFTQFANEHGYAVIALESGCLQNHHMKFMGSAKWWDVWNPKVTPEGWYPQVPAGKELGATSAHCREALPMPSPSKDDDGSLSHIAIEPRGDHYGNQDLRFVKAVIDQYVATSDTLDESSLHLAGFSNGGLFATIVARYLTNLEAGPVTRTPIVFQSLIVQGTGYPPGFKWASIPTNHPDVWVTRGAFDHFSLVYTQEELRADLASAEGVTACRGIDWLLGHAWSMRSADIMLDLLAGDFADYSCGSSPIHTPQ